MKKILAILLSLLTLLSCGLLSACSAEKTQPDTLDTETVWETVSEAYIYAFPLVLTDATKTLSTNTDGTMTGRAPINQFNHVKKLAERSPQESSVSSDSRIASIFFMLSSYDSFLLWSSSRNGLCVWIDYEVVCDFLFMVNYRLFRPFLSASLESSFLTASICGSNSARSAKII